MASSPWLGHLFRLLGVVDVQCSLAFFRLRKILTALLHSRLRYALIRHHVLAGVEHRPIIPAELATAVDIGANRGQFALALRQWAPAARIFAFEPLADAAAIFRKVFALDDAVALFETAIGPYRGQATLHVSASDDSTSMLPISSVQTQLFPGTHEVRVEAVSIAPLADFISAESIKPPALLKLDVQGYELEALKGCKSMLGLFNLIYVECSFLELYEGQALADQVIEYLGHHTFRFAGVYNMLFDKSGRAMQGDFLFSS